MRADKRLGQHFLVDPAVLEEICAIADVEHSAGVLEIGPGEGALTAYLAAGTKPVVALEKDPRAVLHVRQRLGERVRVVEGDALDADLAALLPPADQDGRRPIVVGNLPYNVGTAIFRRLLALGTQVERMVLMLQREVAVRLTAQPGTRDHGLLSVATAMRAKAWQVGAIPPEAFRPQPKVESALLLVEPLARPRMSDDAEERFLNFVGKLSQSRRKTLGNAVGDRRALEALGIDPQARPETLDLETLIALHEATGGR
ncbi:MAG: ribosomal RNA small subunit methyltransferase A [Deltaproteobacteria bacterium]|nr:ribosomal RNA small subunit methyltransferase A [Deltaproteobacteria bacterium]MCB9786019.1 ribosomal RNA small subunit methyltransferase A [Deltaproteobacteria bacterium]